MQYHIHVHQHQNLTCYNNHLSILTVRSPKNIPSLPGWCLTLCNWNCLFIMISLPSEIYSWNKFWALAWGHPQHHRGRPYSWPYMKTLFSPGGLNTSFSIKGSLNLDTPPMLETNQLTMEWVPTWDATVAWVRMDIYPPFHIGKLYGLNCHFSV